MILKKITDYIEEGNKKSQPQNPHQNYSAFKRYQKECKIQSAQSLALAICKTWVWLGKTKGSDQSAHLRQPPGAVRPVTP